MKQKELLRPFDHALADAGEPICWSHLDTPVEYVGMLVNGLVAVKTSLFPIIETPSASALRMLPLFWKDSRPVYKGDKLWHKIAKKFIEVDCLQDEMGAAEHGFFIDTDGINVMAELCFRDEPKPKPKPAPLFQHEGKDVFPGDRLWSHSYKRYVAVARMQDIPRIDDVYYFVATDGSHCCAAFCSWEKPAPPKTTQVRYANVYNDNGEATLGATHFTKELAEKSASRDSRGVARVEWQE